MSLSASVRSTTAASTAASTLSASVRSRRSLLRMEGVGGETEETPKEEAALYKIVLTGGPCGGKTTAMARLSTFLRERGFEVMTCPEAYGTIISNGVIGDDYFSEVPHMGREMQSSVFDLMVSLEDSFVRILRARGKPAVLLCDRGIMDGSVYCTTDEWRALLKSKGIDDEGEVREGRYHAVYHLVTAAEGAEAFYTLENNAVRTETPEEARVVDRRTQAVWLGHPRLQVFDNHSIDFETKLRRLVRAAAALVGLPSELDKRSTAKYLMTPGVSIEELLNKFPSDVPKRVFEVEKVYLYDEVLSPDQAPHHIQEEYSFVRRRTAQHGEHGANAGSSYGQTTVQIIRGDDDGNDDQNNTNNNDGSQGQQSQRQGQRVIESKRIISAREYNAAVKIRDTRRHIVGQTRISFLWQMQSFTIHLYEQPTRARGLCLLHCQTTATEPSPSPLPSTGPSTSSSAETFGGGKTGDGVRLPPFLSVVRRLSDQNQEDQRRYGALHISLIEEGDEES